MNSQQLYLRYTELCRHSLEGNERVLSMLREQGLTDPAILERFEIGYSDGSVTELFDGQEDLKGHFERIGILEGNVEVLKRRVTISVHDADSGIVNVVGYSPWPRTRERLVYLNPAGIFNAPHLKHGDQMILVDDPIHALLLVSHGATNATFAFGDDAKYVAFCRDHGIRGVVFLFEGRARLFRNLEAAGIAVHRMNLDVEELRSGNFDVSIFHDSPAENDSAEVEEIEGGFLFRFPLLSYRVLGNFSERALHMRANIKAFTDDEVFVDAIDLVRHRNRQNFIYNLMDRFNLRDQVQLEQDLNRMVEVIEEYKERVAEQNARVRPELTSEQVDIGTRMLRNENLIDEIAADYDALGYVQERKNKILLYLVMTSRLMENPLHAIIISRSGGGKSRLAEVTAELCPPEDAETVSDLSQNALYYFGENDLKHKFIVIGEKSGSDGSGVCQESCHLVP